MYPLNWSRRTDYASVRCVCINTHMLVCIAQIYRKILFDAACGRWETRDENLTKMTSDAHVFAVVFGYTHSCSCVPEKCSLRRFVFARYQLQRPVPSASVRVCVKFNMPGTRACTNVYGAHTHFTAPGCCRRRRASRTWRWDTRFGCVDFVWHLIRNDLQDGYWFRRCCWLCIIQSGTFTYFWLTGWRAYRIKTAYAHRDCLSARTVEARYESVWPLHLHSSICAGQCCTFVFAVVVHADCERHASNRCKRMQISRAS